MSEFKIEKGIPIPKIVINSKKRGFSNFLRNMEVGDSVLLTIDDAKKKIPSASQIGKEMGFIFATRKVDGGRRIWRLK